MVNYSIHREKAGTAIRKITDAGIPFVARTLVLVSVSEEDEKPLTALWPNVALLRAATFNPPSGSRETGPLPRGFPESATKQNLL